MVTLFVSWFPRAPRSLPERSRRAPCGLSFLPTLNQSFQHLTTEETPAPLTLVLNWTADLKK